MDVLGADALDGIATVPGDAVAGPGDLDQTLDVEVQEVAWMRVLIPARVAPSQASGSAWREPGCGHSGPAETGLLRDTGSGPALAA